MSTRAHDDASANRELHDNGGSGSGGNGTQRHRHGGHTRTRQSAPPRSHRPSPVPSTTRRTARHSPRLRRQHIDGTPCITYFGECRSWPGSPAPSSSIAGVCTAGSQRVRQTSQHPPQAKKKNSACTRRTRSPPSDPRAHPAPGNIACTKCKATVSVSAEVGAHCAGSTHRVTPPPCT